MRRSRAALVLVVVLAVAGLALLAPAPDGPGSAPASLPEGTARMAGPGAGPVTAPGQAARAASEEAPAGPPPAEDAPAGPGPAAGRVRLTGRLVAARLEWGWVQAVPAGDERFDGPTDDDDDDDAPDVTFDAGGVPTVDPWRAQDPEGALIGRPAGGWAVPRGATRVDRSGAFDLDLAPGTWVVLAGARGCTTRLEALRLEADRDVTWPLEHAAAATLALTCVAAGGEPLAFGRVECTLVRHAVAAPLVAVGDGPWGPLRVEGYASPVDQVETHQQVRLDALGRALLELPPGRVVLGDGSAGALYAACSPHDEGSLRWESVELPPVDVTLAAGERRELTLRQPASEGGKVVVRVRDAAGAPVAGAAVGLSETDDGPAFELLQLDGFATTGPDGLATFLDQAPGATFAVARAGGRSGRSAPRVVQTVGERVEVEVVLDELDPYGAVVVRALAAETAAPVAAPSVSSRDPSAPSFDAQRRVGPGTLRIDGVPLGRRRLLVGAPGRASREVEVEVAAGAPTTVEVRLAPAAVVSGRVRGGTGKESVWLLTPDDQVVSVTQTDAAGAFRFDEGPAPGEELVVRVLGPAWFAVERAVRAPAELEVEPPEGRTPLQVLGADGAPVRGARVSVHDAAGREVASGTTDQEGRLLLLGVAPPGATVSTSGLAPVPLAPDLVLRRAAEVRREPDPPPPPAAQLAGSVLDLAGRPVAGARVWIHDGRVTRGVTTEADGTFLLEASVGPLELVVERADLGRCAQRLELARTGATIVARFQPAVAVRVRAQAAVEHVSFAPAGGWGSERLGGSSSFRRADGAFDLGLLLPGRWQVVLRDDHYEELGVRTIEVTAPGPLLVTLE